MKKLFALLAVVLAVVSCQKDVDVDVNVGGEQLVNITVALPEATRADSAQSGWANTGKDLRVIMQIFDENGNTTDDMRFDEEVLTYGNTTVNYNVRLVPGHKYTFVAWADQGTEGQYFNTSNLKNVTFVDGAWTAMNENIDAYTDTETVEAGNSIRSINLVLTRPFAKVRVVATDINAVRAQGWVPTTAIATYQETVPVSFNAFAGVVGETAPVANPVRHVSYNGQYTDNAGEMTLFADYLYVPTSGTAKFEFLINGRDNNGNAIAIRNDIVFNTPIPAVRNKLTTIKGDILTNGSNIKVEVDEELPEYVMEIVDVETPEQLQEALENTEVGEIILQEDITLDGSLVFGAPATTASTFATRANTDLPGRNITIDGNGKTLKVVKVGTGRVIDFTKETNGASLTLKNLTIENNVSYIERIVNYNTNGSLTLENVKIINAEGCKLNYAINLPASSDNAKVVIKDSEIWANANALNLWGENTVANISRSKLYIVDSNKIEGYSVVALNNGGENAAHNSIINVEGGEIKVMYEGEGETMPSSALRDATNGSEVYISEETVVVGDIIYPVAILTYKNTTDFYSFTSLQAAIDKAKGDANVDAIRLIKDITVAKDKTQSNGYGAVGAQQLYGGIIDGNGKSFSVNAWGTWDSAINTTGGTIKNLNVTGGMRGIFINHNSTYSAKVVLENVTIDGTIYTISCDQGTNNGLEATNCTFNGWTSYAATLGATKFVGCSFGEGQGYAFCRPYATTEFVNCAFEAGYELDPCATVTFENCTIGGVALTAENLSDLVIAYKGAVENASVK